MPMTGDVNKARRNNIFTGLCASMSYKLTLYESFFFSVIVKAAIICPQADSMKDQTKNTTI
jgi:hypothetical protein